LIFKSRRFTWHSRAADSSLDSDGDGEDGAVVGCDVLPGEAEGGVPTESSRQVVRDQSILHADGLRLIRKLVAVDDVAHLRTCYIPQKQKSALSAGVHFARLSWREEEGC
jgi:hypothetical protein